MDRGFCLDALSAKVTDRGGAQLATSIGTTLNDDVNMTNDPASGDPDYLAAVNFLYDRINYEKLTSGTSTYPFRLGRMRDLLAALDLDHFLYPVDPSQQATCGLPKIPLVHLAGTKGKGSTATMVAVALTAAGYRTGLYTSPHLHRLEERFRVDGQLCDAATLVGLVDRLRHAADQTPGRSPSFFELTTALALLHFHDQKCDAVVLETGLGGRLDSTNVCWPSVSAITTIGMDHQHVLGDTLEKIAAEKAGIIKSGVPVVSGVVKPAAAAVIMETASRVGADLHVRGRDFDVDAAAHPHWGSRVTFQSNSPALAGSLVCELPLEGDHQASNAAVAIAIVRLLRQRHSLTVSDETITDAFSKLSCAGRIERYQLADNITGIIDAAHNEDSIAALCRCIDRRAGDNSVAIVFGTSMDKSADVMLNLIADLAGKVHLRSLCLTQFRGNPRFRPTTELLPLVPSSIADRAAVDDDPITACESALQHVGGRGMLVVCGSFFLAAETRHWMANRCGGSGGGSGRK